MLRRDRHCEDEPAKGHLASTSRSDPDGRRAALAHLARLIFLSYRYSQGGAGTQNRMLLYLERHHHPALFGGARTDELRVLVHDMVAPYFLNPETHPATPIPWDHQSPDMFVRTDSDVIREVASLFSRFDDRSQLATFAFSPADIARSVIAMDADYLERPGGRAGDHEALMIRVGPYRGDPFESIYIKYGVMGRTTNTTEFDDMFRRIGSPRLLGELGSHTLSRLLRVVSIFQATHPDASDERLLLCKASCASILDGE